MEKNNITACIIDDTQANIDVLKDYLEIFLKQIEVVEQFNNLDSALAFLNNNEPDILFLDINFGKQTIFELLDILKPQKSKLIFISSYEKYALKSIEYTPSGYLVKPIDKTKLITETLKVIRVIEAEKEKNASLKPENNLGQLKIMGVNTIEIINIEDIIYAEADGRYTSFYLTKNRNIVCSKNLGSFTEELPPSHFIRIHSKYLVQKDEIQTIVKGSNAHCILKNGAKVSISRRRLESLLNLMNL